MRATFAHVGIQQGHPTPSGKTWPLQQSRHHLQTSRVFFWSRYTYTTIPIYSGQCCIRATGHKQWIIRQRWCDISIASGGIHIRTYYHDGYTHTHIYICLSLGHLSGYLYLTLQVFKSYVGIALNHQMHMHSNSSKNRYTNIFVHIIYIYIVCWCIYVYIYIYIVCWCIYVYGNVYLYHISPGVQQGGRQVQTSADYSPLGCSMPLGA